MSIKKNSFLVFAYYYAILIVLYLIFKYGFKSSFIIKLPITLSKSSFLDTYFYQYFLLISISFALSYRFLIRKYSSRTFYKRVLIFAPLIGIITLFIGGLFSGVLFAVHDMLMGFYPGFDRFMSNIFSRAFESSILSPLIAFNSFAPFMIVLSLCSIIILELFRIKPNTTT